MKDDPSARKINDLDGDGKISGEEWDLARQKVITGLEAEESSAQPHETGIDAEGISEMTDYDEETEPEAGSAWGEVRVESFWGKDKPTVSRVAVDYNLLTLKGIVPGFYL